MKCFCTFEEIIMYFDVTLLLEKYKNDTWCITLFMHCWDQVMCFVGMWYLFSIHWNNPDSKVHGAKMGPIWGQQDPGGSHVGPINYAIWEKCHHFDEIFYAWALLQIMVLPVRKKISIGRLHFGVPLSITVASQVPRRQCQWFSPDEYRQNVDKLSCIWNHQKYL